MCVGDYGSGSLVYTAFGHPVELEYELGAPLGKLLADVNEQ